MELWAYQDMWVYSPKDIQLLVQDPNLLQHGSNTRVGFV
jgi:hypothetical protein